MRLYRNIIEYAASLGLSCDTKEEARFHLMEKVETIYKNQDGIPLYHRGEEHERRYGVRHSAPEEIDGALWIATYRTGDTKALRALWKKAINIRKREMLGENARKRLGYLSLDEYNAIANEKNEVVTSDFGEKFLENDEYPFRYGARIRLSVGVVFEAKRVFAEYDRGKVVLHLHYSTFMNGWLPCKVALFNAIVLYGEPIADGVWWMRVAMQKKGNYQLEVRSGAFYDGQIILGYDNPDEVRPNIQTVKEQGRIMAVTRALKRAV